MTSIGFLIASLTWAGACYSETKWANASPAFIVASAFISVACLVMGAVTIVV